MAEAAVTINRKRRIDSKELFQALEDHCASLDPGSQIPTHTELMRRFGASERAILFALDKLRHAGKIVRRNGVGTFVAEPPAFAGKPPGEPPAFVAKTQSTPEYVQ